MNRKIFINFEIDLYKKIISSRNIKIWINKVLNELKYDNQYSLSLLFVSDEYIQNLNKKYLKKNKPTDVLSFSQIEGNNLSNFSSKLLGDIVIAVPYVIKNAKILKKSLIDEIYYLILHGILHIIGYEHEKNNKKGIEMFKLQDALYEKLKGE